MKKYLLFTLAIFSLKYSLNAQNVGIGEAAPSTKLEVKGDGSDLLNVKDNSNDSKLFIDSDGNVGIGTTTPAVKLHVVLQEQANAHYLNDAIILQESNEGRIQAIASDGGSAGALLDLTATPASGDNLHWQFHHTGPVRNNRLDIQFGTTTAGGDNWDLSTKALTILTNGNVGIGQVAPSFNLDVTGTSRFTGQVSIPLTPTSDEHAASKKYVDDKTGANETDPTWSGTANTTTSVGRTGNVGIGLTSPSSLLHVASTDMVAIFEDGGANNAYIELDLSNAGSPQINMTDKTNDMFWAIGGDDGDNSFKIAGTTTATPVLNTNTSSEVKLTIETGGNIGVGTATPGAKLDVAGTGNFSGQVTIPLTPSANTDAASKKYVDDQVSSGVSGADDWNVSGSNIYNNNSGRVGIGTGTSIGKKLEVQSTAGDDGILMDMPNPALFFVDNTNADKAWSIFSQGADDGLAFISSADDLTSSQNTRLFLEHSTGDVGIGTASPAHRLDIVATNTAAMKLESTSSETDILFESPSGAWQVGTNDAGNGTSSNQFFIYDNAYRFTVQNGTGNVGVATSSPLNTFDVRGFSNFGNAFTPTSTESENILNLVVGANASGESNGIAFHENTTGFGMKLGYDGSGSGADNAMRFYNDSDNPVFTIENGGNIGIGVTAPTYALQVSGRIRSNGINETSDIRYKKNVETLENSLEKVMRLRGVSYDWRQDEFPEMKFQDGKDLGVIAQEIEEIIPEVVSIDNQGYKSVQYSHLVPILIEAIKEQQEIISNQESVICQNTSEISNQSDEIELLKAKVSEMDLLKAEISSIKEQIQMQSKK